METINFRINELAIELYKGNSSKFAAEMGTSEANIRNYRTNTPPKIDFIVTLCEKLEVNFEWLIIGKGEKKRPQNSLSRPEEKLQSVNESDERLENGKSLLQIISNKDDVILKQMEIISSLLQPITTTLKKQDKKLGELDSFAEMLKLYYKIEIEENEIKEAIALEKKDSVK